MNDNKRKKAAFDTDIMSCFSQKRAQELMESKMAMERLGKEYLASADALRARIEQLRSTLDKLPASEKRGVERRIALLEQEIRDAKRIGADAAGFYLPGHRFLPKGSRQSMYPGAYIC